MAELNDNSVIITEKTQKECGMYLQSCLSNKELEELKTIWNESGGCEKIPWWKFALENIQVSLKCQ